MRTDECNKDREPEEGYFDGESTDPYPDVMILGAPDIHFI